MLKGGAVYNNYYSTIGTLSGVFKDNYAHGNVARGGAIFNNGANINKIVNSSFLNNYTTSPSGTSQGGAIYSNNNIRIEANNGFESEFTDNYTELNGTKTSNAIYMDNANSTLTFATNSNASITLNDAVDGTSGYDVIIGGDGSGTFYLNNEIKNADIFTQNGTINLSKGSIKDHTFKKVTSDVATKYTIDIDLGDNLNVTADKIITTEQSSGTVKLTTLNFTGNRNVVGEAVVQIIQNNNSSSSLQLALGNNIIELPDVTDTVTNNTVITDIGGITLATTTTTNDSIKIQGKIYDTLALVNKKQASERNFNFEDTSTYTVTEDLGNTASGTLNINGKVEGENKSTIDMNNKSGFKLPNLTNLNISNVNIINGNSTNDNAAIINSNVDNTEISIKNVTFENNTVNTSGNAFGSVIKNWNWSIITDISGEFNNNGVSGNGQWVEGGVIWNSDYGEIYNINANFTENYAIGTNNVGGGAIYNHYNTIESINGNFEGNYVNSQVTAKGGALYNSGATIKTLSGTFDGNYAQGNTTALGGAVFNDNSNLKIVNSSFTNNYTESSNGTAKGGAIYSNSNITVEANNANVEFTGNYANSAGTVENNAIYIDNNNATLTLNTTSKGTITFNDTVNGASGYNITLTGDGSGTVNINNQISNADITLNDTNIVIKDETYLNSNNTLNLTNGSLSIANNNISSVELSNLTLNGNVDLAIDANLATGEIDRISADKYNIQNGTINISKINLQGDTTKLVDMLFADKEIAQNVSFKSQKINTPIFKYVLKYDIKEDEMGYIRYMRGSSGNVDSYNPTVLSSAAATQAGSYITQLLTYNYAFQHADSYMNMTNMERTALKNGNKYAAVGSTDVGVFSPLMTPSKNAGFWIKPYASFENVPLKNGPKVQNINYGTLIGYDEPMVSLKNGWDRVMTYYIGYNGSTQHFTGVDTYQNGGILGATMSLYKGNFFNATTISAGANVGESSGMFGSETFNTITAGIANKTGYNVEFFSGKFIVQPSLLLAYSFINTFDYTNAAGVKIDSDPMNAIQVAPGVKFIGNTKSGWQPYLAVNMVWNITCNSKVYADNVELPEMSIKPYVQYGLGLQKRFNENFLAFGQAMVHSGGRNGIALTAGLRYSIGNDTPKTSATKSKTVIKTAKTKKVTVAKNKTNKK